MDAGVIAMMIAGIHLVAAATAFRGLLLGYAENMALLKHEIY